MAVFGFGYIEQAEQRMEDSYNYPDYETNEWFEIPANFVYNSEEN